MIIKCIFAIYLSIFIWNGAALELRTTPNEYTALAKPTCSALLPPPITALQKTNIPSLTQHVETVVRANNAFAIALYKELAKIHGDKNFFFSPISIAAALAMTHLGADGKTAEEIKRTLNVSMI